MKTTNWILSLSTIATLSACGSGLELELGELTSDEAGELAVTTLFSTIDITSVLPSRPGLTLDPASGADWARDFEAEVRCPGGGIVVVAAWMVVDTGDEAGVARADYRLAEVHDECGSTVGTHLQVSGLSRTEARVQVEHDGQGGVLWSGTSLGRFEWQTADRRGTCTLDLSFTASRVDDAAAQLRVRGVACGHALDLDAMM